MAHDEEKGEMEVNPDEQTLQVNTDKEIAKLGYFLEETDQIIGTKNYEEKEAVRNRASKILKEKNFRAYFVSKKLKINNVKTSRSVRLWEKETKSKCAAFIEDKERLVQQQRKNQERELRARN